MPTLRLSCLLLAALPVAAWAADPPAPTFERDVAPIFRERCCSCHNPDRKRGGLDLSSFSQTFAGGSSGEVVAPGDADASYLWQLVSHESEPKMPPEADRIPADALDVIRRWIAAGAIERDGAAPAKARGSAIAMASGSVVRPEGPPVLPPRLPREPLAVSRRAGSVTALAASPHGAVVAVGGRRQVLLYDALRRELLGVLPFPEGVAKTVRFSRSGRLLIAGGGVAAQSGRVVVWDVARAERLLELGDEFDEVLAADISADQRLVALGGPARRVRLLRTADGATDADIDRHTDWVTALEFSPDGRLLASGDRAGNLFLWESAGAREHGVLRGHKGGITAVSWRPDGAAVASGSADGTVKVWDAKAGTLVKGWDAHAGGTEGVVWLADGRLASTGHDRRVKLWTADGRLERTIEGLSDIGLRVAATDDATAVLAADFNGRLVSARTADGALLGEFDTNPPPLADRLAAAREAIGTATAGETDARAAMEAAVAARDAATAALRDAEQMATAARGALEAASAVAAAARAEEARWQDEIAFAAAAAAPAPAAGDAAQPAAAPVPPDATPPAEQVPPPAAP
jgi:WD40 repeat protein